MISFFYTVIISHNIPLICFSFKTEAISSLNKYNLPSISFYIVYTHVYTDVAQFIVVSQFAICFLEDCRRLLQD